MHSHGLKVSPDHKGKRVNLLNIRFSVRTFAPKVRLKRVLVTVCRCNAVDGPNFRRLHIRQLMGDALMAIDAGLTALECVEVLGARARTLEFRRHGFKFVC